MELAKVQPRGQVTVPRAIRRAAGIEPGDVVAFAVTAPGRVELRALPRLTLAELLRRYHVDRAYDDAREREAWQSEAVKDVLGE